MKKYLSLYKRILIPTVVISFILFLPGCYESKRPKDGVTHQMENQDPANESKSPKDGVIHQVENQEPENESKNVKDSFTHQMENQEPTDDIYTDRDIEETLSKFPVELDAVSDGPEEVIFSNKLINTRTFVSQVNAGDIVIVHVLSGIKRMRETYQNKQDFLSTWIEKECKKVIVSNGIKKERCSDVRKFGTCTILYEEQIRLVETPIEFDKESHATLAFSFESSYQFHDFYEINFHEDNTMSIVFEIKKEMIKESNKMYIRPIGDSSSFNRIQLGFLAYDDCPGKSKREFVSGGSTKFYHRYLEAKRELQLNLSIIRKEVNHGILQEK